MEHTRWEGEGRVGEGEGRGGEGEGRGAHLPGPSIWPSVYSTPIHPETDLSEGRQIM